MKKLLTILCAILMVLTLAGCSKEEKEEYKVAVVTDVGQLNDGGFNQYTYEGAKQYAEEAGVSYKYYQPANGSDATDDDRIAAMRQAIENGAEIIVTPGFLQQAAIATVAAESPDVKFVFVDGWNFGLSNVTAICYAEEEAGYFAGYAAVKEGYTKLGGTFGGAGTNAACNRYCYGYVQGINAAASELGETVDVTVSFLNGAAFAASNELKVQMDGWYNNGTQVIFSCGGSMLQSVKAAAEETADGKIIGVDVDQSGESDRVITSACKGLKASVYQTLKTWAAGNWDAELADKTVNKTAANEGTELPTATWSLKNFTVEEYKALFDAVVAGTVTISKDCLDLTSCYKDGEVVNASWKALMDACTNVNLTVEE